MRSVRFFPHWSPDEPAQVIGYLHLINAILAQQARIASWVEVGAYIGESATLLAGFPAIESIALIEQSAPHAERLTQRFAQVPHVAVHRARSPEAASQFSGVDVVYIDADHAEPSVRADITAWRSCIRPGGWIAGHDYCAAWPGVRAAVDALLGPPAVFADGSWLVRLP